MALQIATGNHIQQVTLYELGYYDSLYVTQGAVVANSEDIGATSAVTANGSDQSIVVNGEVIAHGPTLWISQQHDTDGNESIEIGATGEVYSQASAGIRVESNAATITNSGSIAGHAGIFIESQLAGGLSEVVNRGTIDVANNPFEISGPEAFLLNNKGRITGGNSISFYGFMETSGVTIRNSGTMEGAIIFGGAADTYDGRGGTIDSQVHGFGGDDTLIGGAGTEQFVGGVGHDVLTGGGGADDFIYNITLDSTTAASGEDLITDFSHKQHDQIDLHGMDAVTGNVTNDAFHFIGQHAFDGSAGELRYVFKGGHTFVLGDTDGDKQADFSIELANHVALAKGDFIL